jgi:phage shock protein PspC (stress-responsive transcriptional regulator)
LPEPLSIAHEGANMQHVNDQRFYRSSNRILGGVCAGLAEGFHLDVLWVRVAFLLLLFVQGLGLFIYVVLWLVMPERLEGGGQRSGFDAMMTDVKHVWGDLQHQLGSASRPAPSETGATTASAPASTDPPPPTSGSAAGSPPPQGAWRNQTSLFGVILLVIGLGLLGNNIGIFNWSVVWPAGLIVLGIVILVRNLETRP